MKILVDENIPSMTVAALRDLGHDVADIRRSELEGSDDDVLWWIACEQRRLLITTDRGFARRRAETHSGMLIVTLRQPNRHRIHRSVMEAFAIASEPEWPGLLIVVRDRTRSTWRASP